MYIDSPVFTNAVIADRLREIEQCLGPMELRWHTRRRSFRGRLAQMAVRLAARLDRRTTQRTLKSLRAH